MQPYQLLFDTVLSRTDPEKAHHAGFRAIRAVRPLTGAASKKLPADPVDDEGTGGVDPPVHVGHRDPVALELQVVGEPPSRSVRTACTSHGSPVSSVSSALGPPIRRPAPAARSSPAVVTS